MTKNTEATIMITFHTAAVVACVALVGFAAEQKERSVETSVLARNGRIDLKGE